MSSSAASTLTSSAVDALRVTEARYRALFQAIDEGFCIIKVIFDEAQRPVDYQFLEANPAFERQSGIAAARGRFMREIAPTHEQHWFDIYGRVALTGESVRFERPAAALDDRWFNVFAFRVDAPEDRHVAVLFSDITERRRAHNALRESEAQLRRLIDHMAGFVAMLDREGTLLEIGEPALRVAGLTRAQVIGRKFWECNWWPHDPGQQERIRRWVGEAAQGATVRRDVVARTASDARLAIDLMLAPVFDSTGKVTHVIPSGVDVSARKRMEVALRENEARLNQAAVALQDADRRKDEFLATLAHELRNPLAPIRNGVQILRLIAAGDQTLQRTTEMMDRQVSHLVRLVDDLLDVSRITRGKVELRREPVLLNQVLSSALESCQSLLEPNGHELHVQIPSEPLCVKGDPDRLTQVFTNLLSNAAKFTPRGGAVWLSLEQQGQEAVVVVRDTGIGIPAEKLHSVFDMFAQVHGPGCNDGLGIGLALVRQLVQMHGGSVTAESEGKGRGSQFTVRLPLMQAAMSGTSAHVTHHPPTAAGAGATPAGPNKRRILVVDDNQDVAESLAGLLTLEGHDVVTCTSGREAVMEAQRHVPELILMDLGMPEMDGLAAARLIRAQPGGVAIRIVALTGWGQEGDRQRTREAGIDEHLVKPVSLDALRTLLAQRAGDRA